MIVEGSGTISKYIFALEFLTEVINFAIVLVVIVVLAIIVSSPLSSASASRLPLPPPLNVPHQIQWDLLDST